MVSFKNWRVWNNNSLSSNVTYKSRAFFTLGYWTEIMFLMHEKLLSILSKVMVVSLPWKSSGGGISWRQWNPNTCLQTGLLNTYTKEDFEYGPTDLLCKTFSFPKYFQQDTESILVKKCTQTYLNCIEVLLTSSCADNFSTATIYLRNLDKNSISCAECGKNTVELGATLPLIC